MYVTVKCVLARLPACWLVRACSLSCLPACMLAFALLAYLFPQAYSRIGILVSHLIPCYLTYLRTILLTDLLTYVLTYFLYSLNCLRSYLRT